MGVLNSQSANLVHLQKFSLVLYDVTTQGIDHRSRRGHHLEHRQYEEDSSYGEEPIHCPPECLLLKV